jgi:hypothetical protein
MLLTREAILAAAGTLPRETVPVPEWGGEVIVATMTGAARDEWEQSLVTQGRRSIENVRAKLVAATVVDEAGSRMFSADDVQALGRTSAAALDRVCKVAQRLNGLTAEELESAKGN